MREMSSASYFCFGWLFSHYYVNLYPFLFPFLFLPFERNLWCTGARSPGGNGDQIRKVDVQIKSKGFPKIVILTLSLVLCVTYSDRY